MDYRISGLDPAAFADLIGAPDAALVARRARRARRMTASSRPGLPCRITREDAALAMPREAETRIAALQDDRAIAYSDAHEAAQGCVPTWVERSIMA